MVGRQRKQLPLRHCRATVTSADLQHCFNRECGGMNQTIYLMNERIKLIHCKLVCQKGLRAVSGVGVCVAFNIWRKAPFGQTLTLGALT